MTEETGNLTEEESKVLELLRKVDYGKLVVTVKNGKPVFVETQRTIPLSEH